MRNYFIRFAVIVLSAMISHAQDCVQWIKRTDVGSYGQRYQHAMAYDPDRGVTVFFGGEIGPSGDATFFNDTQEYDGKQWKQINTAVRPPVRSGHAMVYDPIRKKIVMYGGSSGNGLNPIVYNDTWVYSGDGVNGFWELQQPATKPPMTFHHGMIWDPANRVAFLHAAYWPSNGWTWNGTNWQYVLSGPLIGAFGMAFDSGRGKAMIVGGSLQVGGPVNTVWEKAATTGWQNAGPGPSIRDELAMAYDERRQRVVIVGGNGESVETGETAYEFAAGRGWITLPSLPSGQGRAGAKMVYDTRRGVMVLTGGAGGGAPNAASGGRYSDTWELWPTLFISGQPLDATNEVCTTATFSAGVQGNAPLQFTWSRDGQPLPANERYIGTDTAQLQISSVRHADAGKYELVVRDACDPPNVVTSRVAKLTTTPDSEWIFRATNGPPARFGHGMVYDQARHVTVLFGGGTNHNFAAPFNDLWEWDGGRWTQRVANSITNGWKLISGAWRVAYQDQPTRRTDFAMSYDSRRGVVVIFGGLGKAPDGSDVSLKDLWEWDGERWFFRATNGPIARYGGSMAYDERRGRTVLFGGQPVLSGPGEQYDAQVVWEWDGARWHTNGPPVNPPTPNSPPQPRMLYDSFRETIVFGPSSDIHGYWSFWNWNGASWTNNNPQAYLNDPVLLAMNGTSQGGFAFDVNRRRAVWFGGYQNTPQNRTAMFDGIRWTFVTNNSPPPRRGETAMAYDSDRRVMVMFGGSTSTSGALAATNDTWELAATDAPIILEQPTSQMHLAGETATFRASAVGHGFVAYQWYFQDSLIAGAQSDTLTIPTVGTNDVGTYYVKVGSQCGSATSQTALLTLEQKLQIFSSGKSVTLMWPGIPNVILESSPVVTGPWSTVANPYSPFVINALEPSRFFRLRPSE